MSTSSSAAGTLPAETPARVAQKPPVHGGPGWTYLFASVLLMGSAFHLIKAGLRSCPASLAVAIGTLSAAVGVMIVGVFARVFLPRLPIASVTPVTAARRITAQWKQLLPATVIGMTGGWLGTWTIGEYGASVGAFLNNMTVAFLVIGGVFLGERLRTKETALIVLVVAGAFLFAYTGQSVAWMAFGVMAISCAFNAMKQIVIKQASMDGNLWDLMAAQQVMMGTWALGLTVFSGGLVLPETTDLLLLVASGIVQNFVGMGLLYGGYRIVGVARGAPVYAMRPVVVLMAGLAIGNALPAPIQLLGGAMVVIGSVLLASRGRGRRNGADVLKGSDQ